MKDLFVIFRTDKTGKSGTGSMVAGQTTDKTLPSIKDITRKATGQEPQTILKAETHRTVNTEDFQVDFINKDDLRAGGMTSVYDVID